MNPLSPCKHTAMASEVLAERPLAYPVAVEVDDTTQQSRPTSVLEIEEPRDDEDNTVYPTGPKLWSTMASMAIACFLSGLVTCPMSFLTDNGPLTTLTGPHHCRRRCPKHYRRVSDYLRYRMVLSCIVSLQPPFTTSHFLTLF